MIAVIVAVMCAIALVRVQHADESLTLINRSGDDASEADFKQAEKQLGPGPGTLLARARAADVSSPGYGRAKAAASAATAWYAVHRAVRGPDNGSDYPDAVYLAIGAGATTSPTVIQRQEVTLDQKAGPRHPRTSAEAFRDLEADLTAGIDADYASFTASASRGDRTFGGLAAGMVIASLLTVIGYARGLTQRIAEYR